MALSRMVRVSTERRDRGRFDGVQAQLFGEGEGQMSPRRDIGAARRALLMKSLRLAAALLLVAQAAGCASSSEGVLVPVSDSPRAAARVEMLVATTRQRSPEPGVLFNGERAEALSLENVVVSIPPNREVGSVQWPRPGAADPSRDFAVVSLKPLNPADLSHWLVRLAPKSGRVLVFVHG